MDVSSLSSGVLFNSIPMILIDEKDSSKPWAIETSGYIYACFVHNTLAYLYAIENVVDKIREEYPKLYHDVIKRECQKILRGNKELLYTLKWQYHIYDYVVKIQQFGLNVFVAIEKDIEVLRFQIYQVLTKYDEKNRLLLSYVAAASCLAALSDAQWKSGYKRVCELYRQYAGEMKFRVDTKRTFAPLRIDDLQKHLQEIIRRLQNKTTGDDIDLLADKQVRLATDVLMAKLSNKDIITLALENAGLLAKKKA